MKRADREGLAQAHETASELVDRAHGLLLASLYDVDTKPTDWEVVNRTRALMEMMSRVSSLTYDLAEVYRDGK